jgi:hypothetical protein
MGPSNPSAAELLSSPLNSEEEIPTLVDLQPPPVEAYPEFVWDDVTQVEDQSLTW